MGNKLGRRKQVVDEKYTKPQGLYQHKDIDHKKLRKLILDSKLAPCYPGDDDCDCDLDECPICFLYYPSLNRSRCCMKAICTECFLQMKTPNSSRATQCPFCKTSNYAVEYRGVKTVEEKGIEQLEEQRFIEAKIRIRQKELLDDEERIQKRRETETRSTSRRIDHNATSVVEIEEIIDTLEWDATSDVRPLPRRRQNRANEFEIDLEDIMVMEAIWLSIQESGRNQEPTHPEEDHSSVTVIAPGSGSSPSGGLATAIAAFAERQQMSGEASRSYTGEVSNRDEHEQVDYLQADRWLDHREVAPELQNSYGGGDSGEFGTISADVPVIEDEVRSMDLSLAEAGVGSGT